MSKIGIAIVGCGYVVDYYVSTLYLHNNIELIGVCDLIHARAEKVVSEYECKLYNNIDELLDDPGVRIVINLTTPKDHYKINMDCIDAGKNIYCEKPLALNYKDIETTIKYAKEKGVYISSAPCGIFGETAQTVWKALREQYVGKPQLVYAELDDGRVHKMPTEKWINRFGTVWPAVSEYVTGCTLEHAGYYVSWFVSFFGSVKNITSYAKVIVADKGVGKKITTPDYSVACLEFESGVSARLTSSIVAPFNHKMKIICEEGEINVDEVWNYSCPVYINKFSELKFRAIRYPFIRHSKILRMLFGLDGKKYKGVKRKKILQNYNRHSQDFSKGISELAVAIVNNRESQLSGAFSLHVNEVVLAIQNQVGFYEVKSRI